MEGLGTAFKEEVIEDFGLVKAQAAELLWDGVGHHEVRSF